MWLNLGRIVSTFGDVYETGLSAGRVFRLGGVLYWAEDFTVAVNSPSSGGVSGAELQVRRANGAHVIAETARTNGGRRSTTAWGAFWARVRR
jgi:hypothetical protein